MEFLDITDENGCPTGYSEERSIVHEKGLCHATVHVWIVRYTPEGTQVLMQKRSMNKDSFPGRWDTSSAGHISAGDEKTFSALREVKEELGLDLEIADLIPNGTVRIDYEKEFYGKMFRDNEIAFQYVVEKPVDISKIVCQPEEVESVEWVPFTVCLERAEKHDKVQCAPIADIINLKEYLERKGKL